MGERHQAERLSRALSTCGAADAVRVQLATVLPARELVADDEADACDVQPARCDVGRDEDAAATVAEADEHPVPQ